MQCADLDRYLEAFVDGRLGRGRCVVLRRHLGSCGTCRAKVDGLRQFERELHRQFRSIDQARSVWHGLELSLVRTSHGPVTDALLPSPRPQAPLAGPSAPRTSMPRRATAKPSTPLAHATRGRLTSRLIGVILTALAIGTIYQLGRGQLGQEPGAAGPAALASLARGELDLAVTSSDPAAVEAWLEAELHRPLPGLPLPEGFALAGAGLTAPETPARVVVYRGPGGPASDTILLVEPADAAATPHLPRSRVLRQSSQRPPAAQP